jgi:hypothetical protein
MSSGKTREEKRLVAAVERFQKLEKDRQRMQERGGAGKRSAVDMEPEGQGATRQKGVKMAEWSGAMGDEVSGGADSSGSAAGGGARMGMQRAAMSGGAVTSEMTREERKLVAAVERFQKLEEDRQGTQERTSTGAGEVRKRTEADAPEAARAAKQKRRSGPAAAAAHEATHAPKKQRRSGGARAMPAVEIASTAEQRYNADAPYRAERNGLIGRAVSKFFRAQARSYWGTVLEYHCATDTYTILYEDEDSEIMLHADLQGILAPVPAMSTAKVAKRKTARVGICPHQRQRSRCKECGGASICPHQRLRSQCKECGGAGICPHQRRRSTCKECGGASICPHQRIRSRCKECREDADESMPDGLEEL